MKKKILWLCVIFVIVLVGCLLWGNYRFNPPLAYTQYYIIETSLNDPVIKKAIDEACKIVDSSTTELGCYREGEKEIYPLKKFKRIKGMSLFNCCLKSVLVINITSKNKLGIYEGEVTSEDWYWGKRKITALAGIGLCDYKDGKATPPMSYQQLVKKIIIKIDDNAWKYEPLVREFLREQKRLNSIFSFKNISKFFLNLILKLANFIIV